MALYKTIGLGIATVSLSACALSDQKATQSMLEAMEVRSQPNGVIEVTAPMPNTFADAHLKCAAAREAEKLGFGYLTMTSAVDVVHKQSPKHRGQYRFVATDSEDAPLPGGEAAVYVGAEAPVDTWIAENCQK